MVRFLKEERQTQSNQQLLTANTTMFPRHSPCYFDKLTPPHVDNLNDGSIVTTRTSPVQFRTIGVAGALRVIVTTNSIAVTNGSRRNALLSSEC